MSIFDPGALPWQFGATMGTWQCGSLAFVARSAESAGSKSVVFAHKALVTSARSCFAGVLAELAGDWIKMSRQTDCFHAGPL